MKPPRAPSRPSAGHGGADRRGALNSCHTTKVNPPGFVLERFNAVGAWQDTDPRGGAINSTADVILATVPEVRRPSRAPPS